MRTLLPARPSPSTRSETAHRMTGCSQFTQLCFQLSPDWARWSDQHKVTQLQHHESDGLQLINQMFDGQSPWANLLCCFTKSSQYIFQLLLGIQVQLTPQDPQIKKLMHVKKTSTPDLCCVYWSTKSQSLQESYWPADSLLLYRVKPPWLFEQDLSIIYIWFESGC